MQTKKVHVAMAARRNLIARGTYLDSMRVNRCFSFAWLAVYSASSRAKRVCSVSTTSSNRWMLSIMESCDSRARLNASSSSRPSFRSS